MTFQFWEWIFLYASSLLPANLWLRVSRCLARPRGAQKREAECWSSPQLAYPTRAPLFSRRSLGRSAHQLVAVRKDTVCVCLSAIYLKGESPQSKDRLTHMKVILPTFIQAVCWAPTVCQTPALHWMFPIVLHFSKYLPTRQNLILTMLSGACDA